MKTIIISVVLSILAFSDILACDAAALDCIYISSVQVTGDDNFTLCNRCPDPVTLSDMTMIMDSSPNGGSTQTLAETTIQGLGCMTFVEGTDFDFGFSGGTGETFTLSCPDGSSISVNIPVDPPGGFFQFEAPPVACSGADLANLTITGVNNDDDFVVICNSTNEDIRLDGASVFDSEGPDEAEILINQTVPAGGCLTLFRNEDFSFGLGGADSFTIECGGESISQSWDTDEDQISFIEPCDPAAADIFILEIVFDDPDGGPDNVTICNNSASLVSLDGAIVSDDEADFPDDGDALFGITIAPFSCLTLERGIEFDFGIGDDEGFIIYCGDTIYDSVLIDADTAASGAFRPPGVTVPMPPAAFIPTMGEWGLMSLTLLFLIFGVIKLREETDIALA